jgi:uroporphyrinogen decarboxylase
MTHKERFFTAIHHEEPDLVPVSAGLDMKFVELLTGKKAAKEMGAHHGGGLEEGRTVSPLEFHEANLENQRLRFEAIQRLGTDLYSVSDYNIYPKDYVPKMLDDRTYVDFWGKIYRLAPEVNTNYWIDGIIKSEEDLDKFVPPDPEEMNYDIVDLAVKLAGDQYPVVGGIHLAGMFPYLIRGGLDKYCRDLYLNPRFARRLTKMVGDVQLKIAINVIDRGVDAISESDDIAGKDGPFYRLPIFKELIFPYIEEMVRICHRHGITYLKHSDGNLYPILDALVALGIDGINPIEPQVMDIADVKKRYGQKAYIQGNVDCTWILPFGTEEDVRRDVRRCIDAAAEGGGFVLSESNSMHPNVKFENILFYVDEARKYGRYPLRR